MFRVHKGKEYYTFPGGGQEDGESIEEGVLRELAEETSCKGGIDRLLYVHEYDSGEKQYFYLIKDIQGQPKLHPESEESMNNHADDYYKPMWVDLEKVKTLLLYPLEIRDWLLEDLANDFQNCPKEAFIKISERREE